MEFERVKRELETNNPVVIEAIKLILEKEEEKIGMKTPHGIKDEIRKIINTLGEQYDSEED
ncbi:hypothetical protein GWK41_08600 [Persephonella atlantica]|uniref:Uncharacterized protein n=1 Tax=Persephonella atlantica TaxID=2699429 RepID=A0ABS1GJM3_9AQUI|nr:hypothetical protein [Persephonella atlantica]MBK3333128.1 hypothetical protein [Persephonella atlantica]